MEDDREEKKIKRLEQFIQMVDKLTLVEMSSDDADYQPKLVVVEDERRDLDMGLDDGEEITLKRNLGMFTVQNKLWLIIVVINSK